MRSTLLLLFAVLFACLQGKAQLVPAPYPLRHIRLTIEGQPVRMAYMDVLPAKPNGEVVTLLHGKNFNGFYWRETAEWLSSQGFRVVIPDQIGFGNSDFPDVHYSFHLLAANTAALLDSLGIPKTALLGHSMGGMLATRFALQYPARVTRLVLEDPIGLEDYRTFVPYTSVDAQWAKELAATYETYRAYQESYYPSWKEYYDTYVQVQTLALHAPNFRDIARANALTYAMIYEQPVVYEFRNLQVPTLLLVGDQDRTIVGKALLSPEEQARHGNYPELAKQTISQITGGMLLLMKGIGHIPHVQDFPAFRSAVLPFLQNAGGR